MVRPTTRFSVDSKPNDNTQCQNRRHKALILAAATMALRFAPNPVAAETTFTMAASDASGNTSFNAVGQWPTNGAGTVNAGGPVAGFAYDTGANVLRTPNAGTLAVSFAGDSLAVSNGGLLKYKGNGGTITINNLILNGGVLVNGNSGSNFYLLGNIAANVNSGIDLTTGNDNRTISLYSNIAGSANITLGDSDTGTGSGTIIVGGNNGSFSGNLILGGTVSSYANGTLNASNTTLQLTSANGFGAGSVTLNGGTLDLDLSAGTSLATATNITVNSPAAIELDQPGNTNGATYNFGAMTLGANLTLGFLNSYNYYYGFPSLSWSGINLTNNVTLSTSGTIPGYGSGSLNPSLSNITGNYTLTKAGSASLTLGGSGNNYYGLNVAAGNVLINTPSALPTNALGLSGGTLDLDLNAGSVANNTGATITNSAPSTILFTQSGASGGASYTFGTLSTASSLTFAVGGYYYYGAPSINFSNTNLTGNATIALSGTAGGGFPAILNLGTLSGSYTLNFAGGGTLSIGSLASNYGGINVAAGTVVINGTGGMPTSYIGLSGGTLDLNAPAGSISSSTAVTTNVNSAGTILLIQPGASSGATYNLGTLNLGASLNVTLGNAYYYGIPAINWGTTNLMGSQTISVNGSQGAFILTPSLGPVIGPGCTLTAAGPSNLNILAGTGGNYSGLVVGGGQVQINDAGGFPTGSLQLAGGNLLLYASNGTYPVVNSYLLNTAAALIVSNNATISIDQPGANGGTNYSLGALDIGNNTLTVATPNANHFFYGVPTLSFNSGLLSGNATINNTGVTSVVLNAISDGGAGDSLTTTGSGSVTLAGTSTYSGSTSVAGGTLTIAGVLTSSNMINGTGTSNLVLASAGALPATATVSLGATANAFVNAAQTFTSLASAGTATFSSGATVIGTGNGVGSGAGGAQTIGGISGTGSLTVNGTANLYASTITQNLITIGSSSTVTIADSAAPGNTAATSIVTDISDAGTLDLKNNDLIVTDTTQYATIKALINSAADGAKWDMPGITSSSAKANSTTYGLGYATAASTGTTVFDGQPVSGTETLVKYTLLGDTQLRGTVGIGDYNTVVNNYGSAQDWSGGDFHYGGVVGIGDYDDVLSNYGAHASGNLFVGPSLARSINAAARLSPDLATTDLKLEVNTTTGDVYVLATASAAFTGYTISDPSSHLLGGSTSPDPDKLLSVAAQSGGNTNVYETSGTYVDWFKITETASQVAEGQQQNGFGTHSSRDDTINIPAGGTIDFGQIYNTAASQQDLTFDFAEAGTEPTNGPTYYGAEVDYVTSATPEPASVLVLAIGAMGMLSRRRRKA
jgi:autotransporter-associated beta strand protein